MDSKPVHISNRTPLLDRIDTPADLRRFPETDLKQIADELRAELIDAVTPRSFPARGRHRPRGDA